MSEDNKEVIAGERVGTSIIRPGMSDIQPENLQTPARGYYQKGAPAPMHKGQVLPQAPKPIDYSPPKRIPKGTEKIIHIDRKQLSDQTIYTFDEMENAGFGAGVGQTVLSIQLDQGVEGAITKYGWYTESGAAALIDFGLYVNDDLVAPGGKFLAGSRRNLNQFNPSGGSIDPINLAPCYFPVPSESVIRFVIDNADVVARRIVVRVVGKHWLVADYEN